MRFVSYLSVEAFFSKTMALKNLKWKSFFPVSLNSDDIIYTHVHTTLKHKMSLIRWGVPEKLGPRTLGLIDSVWRDMFSWQKSVDFN